MPSCRTPSACFPVAVHSDIRLDRSIATTHAATNVAVSVHRHLVDVDGELLVAFKLLHGAGVVGLGHLDYGMRIPRLDIEGGTRV